MQAVVRVHHGVAEVNWMWLPSWIGMNAALLKEVSEAVRADTEGMPIEKALESGHRIVIDFLVDRFPTIRGLKEYLSALDLVTICDEE